MSIRAVTTKRDEQRESMSRADESLRKTPPAHNQYSVIQAMMYVREGLNRLEDVVMTTVAVTTDRVSLAILGETHSRIVEALSAVSPVFDPKKMRSMRADTQVKDEERTPLRAVRQAAVDIQQD